MDVARFCAQSTVVVVVGKGGVGKTTVAAALALSAARAGLRTLVVTLDGSGVLAGLYGLEEHTSYDEVLLAGPDAAVATGAGSGELLGRVLTSRAALLEYLESHGLGRVSRRLVNSGALDVVATAIPGVEQVLVLGKVKQLERSGDFDLIVLDAPATGHAVSLLTSSGGLADAARGGPLRSQAEQVVELLSDPSRCQALLVTIPEETPVNELIEAAYRLEDEVGVALGPVVVNACLPVLEGLAVDPARAAAAARVPSPSAELLERVGRAAGFRRARQSVQAEQLERLSERLPLAQIVLPYLFSDGLGPSELAVLSACLDEGINDLAGPLDPEEARGGR